MKKLMSLIIVGSVLTVAGVTQVAAESGVKTLTWVGCGISKKAFMTELAEAYYLKSNIKIDMQGGGATKGIRDVASISTDMGGTCRHTIQGNAEETGVKLIPMAWDALVAITHPNNPVQGLSLQQLKDIYDGKINNWAALGGPDEPIQLIARKGKSSGVGLTLRELLFKDDRKDFAAAQFLPSSGPVEKAVEDMPWAIAVTGISSAQRRNVKLLSLQGRHATAKNIRNGSYMLYRPLYIAVNPLSNNADDIKQFLDFAHSPEGREVIRKAGSVPYLDALPLIAKISKQRRGKFL